MHRHIRAQDDIERAGNISLRVHDVGGRLVRILDETYRAAGSYEVGWNGQNDRGQSVASGIYFYRLIAPGFTQARKMILLK